MRSGLLYCPGTEPVFYWYVPTGGSSDRFNSCFNQGTLGMPQNYAGWQYARSGISYAGIDMCETSHYRDYITGRFFDTLTATKKYCVTFYVSLGDSLWFAVSGIGAYLSADSICEDRNFPDTALPYIPQIENPSNNILTDKINWVPVSGEYTASGGETFITIGDFYSDTLSHFTYIGHGGTVAAWQTEVNSYYYIDDVYVRELTIADAGISTSFNDKKIDTICKGDVVQIGRDSTTTGVSFSWLPITGLSNPNIAQPVVTASVTTTYTLTVVNDSVHGCNCKDSVTKDSMVVVVKTCVGVDNLRVKHSDLSIEPNPNNGNFTLTLKNINEPMQVIIYNVLGESIYQTRILSNNAEINIVNQPNGVYFYRVISKRGELVGEGKVVIEK